MQNNFGQYQFRIFEGQLNFVNLTRQNNVEGVTQIPLGNNQQNSNSQFEETIRKEMKRLSIKYFKGREFDNISKWSDEYINDMENFVRNKFPDYKFFLCVIAIEKARNVFRIWDSDIYYEETDGNIEEIYEDKILFRSYLMYIKIKNYVSVTSMVNFEKHLKPKMRKTMLAYLDQRKYDHEEFRDYIKGMGEEFVREIKNSSQQICSKIIIIFFKSPVYGYYIDWKWLNGNNIHHFFEKYDGKYTKCLGIIGLCIP